MAAVLAGFSRFADGVQEVAPLVITEHVSQVARRPVLAALLVLVTDARKWAQVWAVIWHRLASPTPVALRLGADAGSRRGPSRASRRSTQPRAHPSRRAPRYSRRRPPLSPSHAAS